MNHILEELQPSASVTLMARAKEMRKADPTVIGLAGGEPDFDTPERITRAAIDSLLAGNTHYTDSAGIPELRAAIAEKLRADNGIDADASRVLVTPGGKYAIYLTVNALLNPGEEALILDPSWVSYGPIVRAAHGVDVHVKLRAAERYRVTREALEAAVTDRTRLLILNYPNNPTGRILHADEAEAVEAFLLAHPQVWLLSDEVYETIVYGEKSLSMGARPAVADRVVTVNGFSKCAAMTGWRLGYLHAPEPAFRLIARLYSHSMSCASGFLQAGAAEAFSCREEMERMRRVYEQRRDLFIGAMNAIPGVRAEYPEGAFYAWVFFDLPGMDSQAVSRYLMERARVVGMPGSAYGEEGCALRFSFANATEDMAEAARRIREAVLALASAQAPDRLASP